MGSRLREDDGPAVATLGSHLKIFLTPRIGGPTLRLRMPAVALLSRFRGRALSRFTAFALIALLVTACGGPVMKPADLTLINGPEPETIDPAKVTGQADGRIASALFEGLTARDAAANIIPGIAERWEISPDGRTYTFHLREAKWSNGDALTARDFLHSWQRTLDPRTMAAYNYQLFYIKGAEAFVEAMAKWEENIKATPAKTRAEFSHLMFEKVGVRAPDDRTLVVTLADPTPFFDELLATPALAPVHLKSVEANGRDWVKPGKLVGNGAYSLTDWRLDDRFRLEANPNYWAADKVKVKTIDALSVAQASTAFNLFFSGKADLIIDKALVPPLTISHIRREPYFNSNPFLATYYYRFNFDKPPLNDVRVRQALSMAIDREHIVKNLTRAGEPVAPTFVPPGIPGYVSPKGINTNFDEARRLLAAAGFPEGKGFPTLTLLYRSADLDEQISTAVQASWREQLGINVTLRNQEWKVYLASIQQQDFDIARSSWVGDYRDPNTFLDMYVTGGGNNNTGYSSKAYDAAIEAAKREADPQKRMKILHDAEVRLIETDTVIAPIYFYVGIALFWPDKLGGFVPNQVDDHPLRDLFFKEAKR